MVCLFRLFVCVCVGCRFLAPRARFFFSCSCLSSGLFVGCASLSEPALLARPALAVCWLLACGLVPPSAFWCFGWLFWLVGSTCALLNSGILWLLFERPLRALVALLAFRLFVRPLILLLF